MVLGLATSRVHSTAAAAAGENADTSSSPSTARSWLPTRQSAQRSATRVAHSSGCAPYPTTSPRHQSSSGSAPSTSASTASSAGRFAWMSLMNASRMSQADYRRRMANPGGRRRALRVGAAAVAMVLVAEGAVWLLRPRDRPIRPASVSERDYFTAAQIDRGQDYSDGQLWLYLAALGAQGVVLVTLAVGRPRGVRRRLDGLGVRPVLG